MFIKKFILKDQQGQIIREVVFKKGMNIILGKNSKNNKGSSNNLGKTTLIRCIDFCLDGKLDAIYTDPEFKGVNLKVENFLTQIKPTFSLTLAKSFESRSEMVIERKVDLTAKRGKVRNFIDGVKYSASDFQEELKKRIFSFDDSKPTFRQLIGKFIRSSDHQISQILRYNSPYTKDIEYEKIHLFLLGFDSSKLLTEKSGIELQIGRLERVLSVLKNRNSRNSLEQKLYILNQEMESLQKKRDDFKINEKYEKESKDLETSQLRLNSINQQLSDLRLRAHINTDRIEKLENDQLSLSSSSLKYLYQEAGYYSSNLAKTFDDLVSFHNSMMLNEIGYLKTLLAEEAEKIELLEDQKNQEMETYNSLLAFLGRSGSLAEYTKLNEKISSTSEEIGSVDALLNELTFHESELLRLNQERDSINEIMNRKIESLNKNQQDFNGFFSSYTEQLDGEKYYLAYETNADGLYKFRVAHLHGNTGSGHKQAVVIAFDLAYMAFCNHLKLNRPLFATMDKIEIIDIEKLKTLIKIANEQNGQFIAPFIQDKLDGIYPEIKTDIILTLSEGDRFFRIEKTSPNL